MNTEEGIGDPDGNRTRDAVAERIAAPPENHAQQPRASLGARWIAGVFIAALLAIDVLHPRISIMDVDAHACILGAQSLRTGKGYRDLHGTPLNHWPPGYAFILSLAPQPIIAAQIINYASFAGAVTMLAVLAARAGWPRRLALALATAFGFGLLRILAFMAKPDILTFFLFFFAAWLYLGKGGTGRLLGCFLWSSLIPIKLIAVVFTPGVLFVDWWLSGNRNFWARLPQHLVAGLCWLLFLAGTLAFNYFTINSWSSPSYLDPTIAGIFHELKRFADSLFLGFLTTWYGRARTPEVWIATVATLCLGLAALATLQRSEHGKWLRWMGAGVLVMSWLLESVRLFYADPRLMGYGVFLFLLGFVPRGRSAKIWIVYAGATVALAVFNVATTVSTGTNHAAYEQLGRQIATLRLPEGPIVSNSFHVLDVHAGIPTRPIESLEKVPRGTIYVEVTLPNYDSVARTIRPAPRRDSSWVEIAAVNGATVYRKTEGAETGELPEAGLRVIY
jgi:hypothetical protein